VVEARRPILSLSGVTRRFGTYAAVDKISFDIHKGEIFSLLGPSGCGKTTTLRLIAGLEQPDEGRIALNDTTLVSVADRVFVPAQGRNMGMVFQSYAIWPHLTVFETVAYPLTVRRRPKAEIEKRVTDVLKLVGLAGYEQRPGPMLSGGQQQRVALARALVYEPEVLLLDEPFSNLDVHLREQMRLELKVLQRRIGVTIVLVTHDQLESLSLSDRIAIMNSGHVEQVGAPAELYERPNSAFVRDFVGMSLKFPASLVGKSNGTARVRLTGGHELIGHLHISTTGGAGDRVIAVARPEAVQTGAGENAFEAEIRTLLFTGDRYDCVLAVDGIEVRTLLPRNPGAAPFAEGQRIQLTIPPESLTIWPS
jgi:ABC-type Fe3+/spermidine/putrescine transport system ATPase subunit